MVLLTTTPQILTALSSLPSHLSSTLSTTSGSLPTSPNEPISHTTLITLSRLLKSHHSTTNPQQKCSWTLNTLLRSTHPYHPPPPAPPQKSPSYTALMARLHAEAEAREYHSLTSKTTQSSDQFQQALHGEKDDITPSLVFNILLSIVMCGAATFHITRIWSNDGIRVLVSLLVAIIVGVAEVVVYASYLRKVKEGREKEARIRERKEVVGTEEVGGTVGGGEAVEEKATEGESEEIWGRGVHGGMRRRVREKWEREKEQEGVVEK